MSNKVSRNVYSCGRPSEDSTAKAREKVSSDSKYDIEAYFLANFYDAYGEKLSNKLFDNLADLGYGRDMHSRNFGKSKDSKIVCLDYADFNDFAGVI